LRRNIAAALSGFVAIALLVCVSGCAVALAPGFRIAKETRAVHFLPGPTPALSVEVDFTLQNTGTSELNFIDVRLPSKRDTGRTNLHVKVDGREIMPEPLLNTSEQPDAVRIAFKKPWKRKENRKLSFAYELRAPADFPSYVTVGPNSFHLGLRGWAPQLQPYKYVLTTYPSRPARIEYVVRVPKGFLVLAGGSRKGQKNYGNEVDYRYEVRGADLGAFVVAGRYAKWPANVGHDSVSFWTTQPLVGSATQSAKQVADIWKTLTSDFGVFDKHIRAPHVIESAGVRNEIAGDGAPAAVSVPGGALLNPAAFELGIDSPQFLQTVSTALARNWFDEEVLPSAEAEIGMGEGLPEYTSIVTDEARNGRQARRQLIYEYLRRYDAAVKAASETPIASTTADSPLPQRRIALAKAPLFYIEIEDACGEKQVRAGLAHMLTSMRGQEVDYNVLRSVLEESTGRQLGKIFREWLYRKGISGNFRARYPEGAEETGN
jgi:hypothetical protein